MKRELLQFILAFKRLYVRVLGIREGADIPATIEGIKRDIVFRGPTAWILMFSIMIASIGLNVNSVAVIIGAMLISPLMGPILGIGMAVGTNDVDTLIKALKNLGIAVVLSLITSTVYFLLTPLDIIQSELISRTNPTVLDVLIALFGGFAGIMAGSRKEKTNVIPGVAIATALMPPLCTAGYGLANLNWHFFFGAFYLFFINSVFISLSTYLVVKYLRFPMVKRVDEGRSRRYKYFFSIFLLVTILPSAILFFRVVQEARFNLSSENFINNECLVDGSELLSYKYIHNDTLSRINLYYIGETITGEQQEKIRSNLQHYGLTGNTRFPFTQKTEVFFHQENDEDLQLDERFAEFNSNLRLNILEDIYNKNTELINDKEQQIEYLENELVKFRAIYDLPFQQLQKEITFQNKNVERFSFARTIELSMLNDTLQYDTIPTFLIGFKKGLSAYNTKTQNQKLEEWLKVRMNDEKVRAVPY